MPGAFISPHKRSWRACLQTHDEFPYRKSYPGRKLHKLHNFLSKLLTKRINGILGKFLIKCRVLRSAVECCRRLKALKAREKFIKWENCFCFIACNMFYLFLFHVHCDGSNGRFNRTFIFSRRAPIVSICYREGGNPCKAFDWGKAPCEGF